MSSFTDMNLRATDGEGGWRTNYIKGPHTMRKRGQVAADRASMWRGRNIYDFAMTMPGDLPLRRALNRSFRMKRIGGSTASATWVVPRGCRNRQRSRARGFGDSSRFISGPHFLDCETIHLILSNTAITEYNFNLHFTRNELMFSYRNFVTYVYISHS